MNGNERRRAAVRGRTLRVMRSWVGILLFAALASAGDIGGTVVDPEGKPVADVEVLMRVGLARYALTPHYDEWLFVGQQLKAKTDDAGKFTFTNLPDGAVGSVYVQTTGGAGFAQGTADLKVQVQELGSLKGKVSGKRQQLKGVRVWVRVCRGFSSAETKPDPKTGRYAVPGIAAGDARVFVKNHNFNLAIHDVEVVPKKTISVKSAKFTEKYIAGTDTLVDATKIKFVDAKGKPLQGIRMWWSSRFMDGGMNSDADGVIKMIGGAVAIGGPPYILRYASLEKDKVPMLGTFKKVKRGVAIVEVGTMVKLTGTVKVGDDAVEHFRLAVVGPAKTERVYHAHVADGSFTVYVPAGKCRFVVGTVDGKLRTKSQAVQAANLPIALEFPE